MNLSSSNNANAEQKVAICGLSILPGDKIIWFRLAWAEGASMSCA
jgi:hypothetical protein